MVTEDKEWEGYYPNDLDQEMKGYYYGDRLYPYWYNWTNTNNWGSYYNNQGNFAPPYDPWGHFESPYYHYDHRWWGDYWKKGWKGYWGAKDFDTYKKRWARFVQTELGTNDTDLPPPIPFPPGMIF